MKFHLTVLVKVVYRSKLCFYVSCLQRWHSHPQDLYHHFTESPESRSPDKLEALGLLAVPNPGEAARENLPPCHSVRIKLEAREFEEARHESKKEYEKKFR